MTSPPSAHTDLPIPALRIGTSDYITHNDNRSPSTQEPSTTTTAVNDDVHRDVNNTSAEPLVGGIANDVQDLKRRYLSYLPLAKVIDICLSLDAHVPAATRESTWPKDFEAVIAALSSPTEMGDRDTGDAKDGDEKGSRLSEVAVAPPMVVDATRPPAMASIASTSITAEETATPTPALAPPVPPTPHLSYPPPPPPYPYAPQPYAYPPYFPATQPYFSIHQHPMSPHPPLSTVQHASPSSTPASAPPPPAGHPTHSSPPPLPSVPTPTSTSLHLPLPPLPLPPVVPPHPHPHEDLPSYEEMIALALSEIDITGEGAAPKTLFNWMAAHYPLQTNFRPSASQALQKAYKRGRLEKSGGGRYRLNAAWEGGATSKRATRRPQTSSAATTIHAGSSTTTITPHAHAQGIAQPTTSQRPSPAPLFTQTPLSLNQRSSSSSSQHQAPQSHSGGVGAYTFSSYLPPGASAVKAESSSSAGAGGGGDAENMDLDASTWEAAQAILRAINFGLGTAESGGEAVDAGVVAVSAAGQQASENATTAAAAAAAMSGVSPTTITFAPPIIPTPSHHPPTLNGHAAPPPTMLSLTQQHGLSPSSSTPTFQFSSSSPSTSLAPSQPALNTSSPTLNTSSTSQNTSSPSAGDREAERQRAQNIPNEAPGNGRAVLQAHLALLAAQLAEIAEVGGSAVREALGEVSVCASGSTSHSRAQAQSQLPVQTTLTQPQPPMSTSYQQQQQPQSAPTSGPVTVVQRPQPQTQYPVQPQPQSLHQPQQHMQEMRVDEGDQTDDGDEDVEMEAVVPPIR